MKIKLALLTFGLITMLFLAACQSKKEPASINTPLATVTNTIKAQVPIEATPTLLPPTATRVTGNETTSARINAPTASATVVLETATPPSPLVTATVTAVTLTPLPALTADERDAAVAELLANPMTCDVPCWWGAVPGTTKIDEITHFLSHYYFHIEEYRVEGQTYLRVVKKRNDFEEIIVYGFSDSVLTDVVAYTPSIAYILTKFGQPDEVWLSAMNDPRETQPLLWFLIIYLQQGIGIGYVVDGETQETSLRGCFTEETELLLDLHLVIPGSATKYQDYSTIFDKERLYLPLEEATDLTIDDFVQRFSDPAQPQCIETPAEIWD